MTQDELKRRLYGKGCSAAKLVDSAAFQDLSGLLDRIDTKLQALAATSPILCLAAMPGPKGPGLAPVRSGPLATLNERRLTLGSRLFLKSLVKATVGRSRQALRIALSPGLLGAARDFLGRDKFHLCNVSVTLHLTDEHFEYYDFHSDAAEGQPPMLTCWVPLTPVLASQEIRVIPYSGAIGSRGRAFLRSLPRFLQRLASIGCACRLGEAYLWSGRTLHARDVNRQDVPSLSAAYFYGPRPWDEHDVAVDAASGGVDESRFAPWSGPELEEILADVWPRVLEALRKRPDFDAGNAMDLLRSGIFSAHCALGRQLRLLLDSDYRKIDYRLLLSGGLSRAPERPDPEWLTHANVQLGINSLAAGQGEAAEDYLREAEYRAANERIVLEEVRDLGQPRLFSALAKVTRQLGLTERASNYEALLGSQVQPR